MSLKVDTLQFGSANATITNVGSTLRFTLGANGNIFSNSAINTYIAVVANGVSQSVYPSNSYIVSANSTPPSGWVAETSPFSGFYVHRRS